MRRRCFPSRRSSSDDDRHRHDPAQEQQECELERRIESIAVQREGETADRQQWSEDQPARREPARDMFRVLYDRFSAGVSGL